jgi:hypothetical protein
MLQFQVGQLMWKDEAFPMKKDLVRFERLNWSRNLKDFSIKTPFLKIFGPEFI